jgi:hypothetical protein
MQPVRCPKSPESSAKRLIYEITYNQLYAEYKDDLYIHEKRKQAINDISN